MSNFEAKIYKKLPQEAKLIREEVFLKEQGFKTEYDEMDDIAIHIVMYDSEIPVATCRIFESESAGEFILGRLAVKKECRGKGIGSRVVTEAEKHIPEIGGKSLILHSQLQAKDFYEKLGFVGFGEVEYEQGCPHIWMKKEVLR